MSKIRNTRPNRDLEEQGQDSQESRPHRQPVSEDADIMTAYGISKDKFPRWVLDIRNNVPKKIKLGYEFVYSNKDVKIGEGESAHYGRDIGSAVCEAAGWDSREGRALKQYLMVIDRETYEARQASKEADNLEVEQSMTDVAYSNFSADQRHNATPYGTIKRA